MTTDEGRQGKRVLLLLNGLPGAGKSAIAAELAVARPGTLCLDIDLLRSLVTGPSAPGIARDLALVMATAHLRGGRDVVVPQLVARPGQVHRFAAAASSAGADLVHVVVSAPWAVRVQRLAGDDAAYRADLDASRDAVYDEGLREVIRAIGVVAVVDTSTASADTARAGADLLAHLLGPASEQADDGAGQAT